MYVPFMEGHVTDSRCPYNSDQHMLELAARLCPAPVQWTPVLPCGALLLCVVLDSAYGCHG